MKSEASILTELQFVPYFIITFIVENSIFPFYLYLTVVIESILSAFMFIWNSVLIFFFLHSCIA